MHKEIILAIHGLGGHCGWFDRFQNEITKYDIDFIAFDLPGFGLNHNEASVNNVYQKGHINNYQEWIDYAQNFYEELQNKAQKITILGHSLGAMVACNLKIREEDRLILSVPGFKGAKATFDPKFTMSTLTKLFVGKWIFGKDIYITMPVSEKSIESEAMKDPMRIGIVTQVLLFEILRLQQKAKSQLSQITNPILLIQIEDDKVVDNQAQDEALERIKSKDKSKKIFANCDHDWIWYPNNAVIAKAIADWIRAH